LILRKIIKIVATVYLFIYLFFYRILKLKCTTFDFGWGSAQDSAAGAYSAPPDPLAGYKVPTSKEREGRKDGTEGQGRGKGPTSKARGIRKGDGIEEKGEEGQPPNLKTELGPSLC